MNNHDNDVVFDSEVDEAKENGAPKKSAGKDIIARIVCLFLAFVIWLYVMNVESPDHEEVYRSIGVSLENASALKNEYNMSVISGTGNVADVTIKGKKSELSRYTKDDIKVYVDLSQITETGRHTLDIKVDTPAGLTVTDVSPSTIQVYVDNDTTKTVSVVAKARSYTLEASCELGELVPDITEVIVRGPANTLELVDHALVEFDLGNVSESVVSRGELVLVDKSGELISNPYLKLSTTSVQVSIPVFTYKEVPLVADYKYGYFNEENADVSISPSTVTLKADPRLLLDIESITVATIDEKKISGDYFQEATILLPDGVSAVNAPTKAEVSIKHKNTGKRTLAISEFNVINPKDIEYDIGGTLNVELRAPTSLLSYLTPNYITATVDLTHINNITGIMSLPVTITVDPVIEGKVYEIGDYRMQLEIK